MPFSNSHNTQKLHFPAKDGFPDMISHNNHKAKVFIPKLSAEHCAMWKSCDFRLGDAIETGIDNPGDEVS